MPRSSKVHHFIFLAVATIAVPQGEVTYGQTFLCISFDSAKVETVAQQLLYTTPYIYQSKGERNHPTPDTLPYTLHHTLTAAALHHIYLSKGMHSSMMAKYPTLATH